MEMHSRFEIIRTLGHGGMATVYLAYDGQDGRNVALKVLASNLAGDDVYRARFLLEARLAARVRHPNVVRVYGVGEDARGPFIAMEVVEGPTLADEITRRGRFSPGDAAQVAAELASALAELHASQLVHRDVTPRNVLLDREGRPKLADFGIARLLDGTRLTEHGTIMGTAAYVSPEQARGEVVTPSADVYSLGAVLYELLTGRPPFAADTLPALLLQRENGAVVPPRKLVPDVSLDLERTVLATLERDPKDRPSAAALGTFLAMPFDERRTRVLPAAAATRVLRSRPERRSRTRKPAIVGAAAVAALVLLVAGIVRATADGSAAGSPPGAAPRTILSSPVVVPPPSPPPAPRPSSFPAVHKVPRAKRPAPHGLGHGRGKKKGHEKHGHDEDGDG